MTALLYFCPDVYARGTHRRGLQGWHNGSDHAPRSTPLMQRCCDAQMAPRIWCAPTAPAGRHEILLEIANEPVAAGTPADTVGHGSYAADVL